jgi:hypothetical protein
METRKDATAAEMKEPKERAIRFSDLEISAILAGRKTQTRRAIQLSPSVNAIKAEPCNSPGCGIGWHFLRADGKCEWHIKPPYKVGERLWVREVFMHFEQARTMRSTNGGPFIPTDDVISGGYGYRVDLDSCGQVPVTDETGTCLRTPKGNWRPSIFMPRVASRITLEIKDVHVERLQDISEDDAWEEGVTVEGFEYATQVFRELWDKINGKKHPWSSNPFVWCISFTTI